MWMKVNNSSNLYTWIDLVWTCSNDCSLQSTRIKTCSTYKCIFRLTIRNVCQLQWFLVNTLWLFSTLIDFVLIWFSLMHSRPIVDHYIPNPARFDWFFLFFFFKLFMMLLACSVEQQTSDPNQFFCWSCLKESLIYSFACIVHALYYFSCHIWARLRASDHCWQTDKAFVWSRATHEDNSRSRG